MKYGRLRIFQACSNWHNEAPIPAGLSWLQAPGASSQWCVLFPRVFYFFSHPGIDEGSFLGIFSGSKSQIFFCWLLTCVSLGSSFLIVDPFWYCDSYYCSFCLDTYFHWFRLQKSESFINSSRFMCGPWHCSLLLHAGPSTLTAWGWRLEGDGGSFDFWIRCLWMLGE